MKQELKGCINDVKNLKEFLITRGFHDTPETLRTLTDDQTQNEKKPTKENILNGINWLVAGAKPGDHLFFHYSGHGSQVKDVSGDEADGYDETIVPLDFRTSGQIIDDVLHDKMVKPLKKGIRLTTIFDCCHSGTVLDLPFIYKTTGEYDEAAPKKTETEKTKSNYVPEFDELKIQGASEADIVSIAGCRDDQTSADVKSLGTATGAMSFALLAVLKNSPHPILIDLLNRMRDALLQKKYTQVPQMSTGHHINPYSVFEF